MPFWQFTNCHNTIHRMFIAYHTTQGIARICRIHNDATLTQNFYRLINQTRLRIFRVDIEKLAHNFVLKKLMRLYTDLEAGYKNLL